MSELVDSDVVFRGFSSCEDSAGARISQYFLVSRKKGGFVLFSVVSNMKTEEARTLAKDERLAVEPHEVVPGQAESGDRWL